MEFITHSTRYEISQFYQQFGKDLPKLVMVTDGYFGETKDTTFTAGQIIRFHTYSQQRRIKAVAKETDSSLEAEYSIPLDHSNPMIICDENRLGNEARDPLLLSDIIENHKLPLQVQLDERDKCEDATSAGIVMVTLRKEYDEIFLLGNTLEDGCLNMRIVSVPLNSKGMTVALVIGTHGHTDEEWSKYCMELNETVVSCISFNHRYGPSGIRLYNTKSTLRKQQPLRKFRKRISSLFLSRGSMSLPEADTTLSYRPSTTEDDGLGGETNARLNKYPTLSLTRRTVSCYNRIDDSQIHLMYRRETIITVTDVSNLLKKLKLERYVIMFEQNGIDGQGLFTLNEHILQEKYNFRRVDVLKLMFFIRTGHIPQ
ncbi:hypothetical protein ACJMK2_003743 [Sinanodonta woodiana]|uniref:SAM domain-containing protein n=1 Tax=Sinanodonta woodiana TaxID=1069815 RepID=A0ABD3Y0X1_SINWO